MRTASLIALAGMALGCQPPDITLSHMSTMDSQTRGVVLYADGQRGHAAMWDTTCEFDTLNGWIIGDHDLPTESEEIQDIYADRVLGRSDEGAHVVQDPTADLAQEWVTSARLTEDGVVSLVSEGEHCMAVWQLDAHQRVPDAACLPGAAMTADPQSGQIFVGTEDGLLGIHPTEGTDTVGESADLLVWDPVTELMYAATKGDAEVRGLDRDGAAVWTTEVPGSIKSLDDMGERGMVLVAVRTDTAGALVLLDGLTGKEHVVHETPPADDIEVTASDDGTTLAAVLSDRVYFYDVLAEGEEPKKRKTLGVEDAPVFTD